MKHTCTSCPPPKRVVTQHMRVVVLVKDIPPSGRMRSVWDIYRCDEHMPVDGPDSGYWVGRVIPTDDGEWTVLESTTTDLRGDV